MANVALADLIAPYLLHAENLGANHAALSVIRVTNFETAVDAFGICIRGRAEFNGQGLIDIGAGRITIAGATNEASPVFDPQRRTPVFDLAETSIDFELFVPRVGSLVVGQGEAAITAAGFQAARDVLDVWDALPVDTPPSDYPSSGFTLDLILNLPSVRPPFLHPAKMTDRGLLVPDATKKEVSLTLPRLRLRLSHGNALGSQLGFELISAGSTGLDDPGDIGEAELISMDPPYAFIGGPSDRIIGIGFRKAVLDLSSDSTPPEVLAKFGFGDDWGGLYLPEARIFIAPGGAQDLAVEAGVQDLLIGFGSSAGISGDFDLAVIDQGSGDLDLSARFFDAAGKPYGIERLSSTTARVSLPAKTRMVIDVQGGLPPYDTKLKIGAAAAQAGRLFELDLTSAPQTTLVVTAVDKTVETTKAATLTIQAQLRTPQQSLPVPAGSAVPALPATPDAAATDPKIVIAFQNDLTVTLTTDPQNPALMWSAPPNDAETGPSATFSVDVPPGQSRTVRARLPATTVASELSFFFYFDEPARVDNPQQEVSTLGNYAANADNVWSTGARSPARADGRQPGGQNAFDASQTIFATLVPAGSAIKVYGEASFENAATKLDYNYQLARRRAIAVREALRTRHAARGFSFTIDPEPSNSAAYGGAAARFPTLAAWQANWQNHGDPNRQDWWRTTVVLPTGLNQPERRGDRTLTRPAAVNPPAVIPPGDPPAPAEPAPPSWFRSAKIKVRIVRDVLVAVELDLEVDFQTAAEEKVNASGQLPAVATPSKGRTLAKGKPLAASNPADGITQLRFLAQSDQATGLVIADLTIGADPADTDGLFAFGWLPGEAKPANKDVWLTLAGSYLSFWPMLVDFSGGNRGGAVDAALTAAALVIPGVVAVLPWFRVERVIVFGGEYLQRDHASGVFEAYLLFDVEADWSADIEIFGLKLITIDRDFPLAVRYKAMGLRFGNGDDPASPKFTLRPVFDASKGFTIDVARGGSIKIAPPFDKILKILAARLSRTNPLTFEIDIGCGVDLGVVTIDRVRLRVYLDQPRPPELTAFGASIDVPGAIAGSGYLEIGAGEAPGTSKIGGQIDVTIRPINLRVAAAFEMQDVIDPNDASHHATAIYVGLNLVLPVGLPLGTSGLGIFGFRGIFGMHYQRNDALGTNGAAPALGWLEQSDGQPHLLKSPVHNAILWKPKLDNWAFGVGVLLGTMEGGFVLNLDGTLLLELPGPRIAIVMNARIISPPPSVDGMGSSGGILAIIEISPDHFLIGLIIDYDISGLIKIRIPVEAFFSFTDPSDWHFYLGQRSDPVAVSVLDIIKATGYLMIKGNGLGPLPDKGLPGVNGFAIGTGAAAAFTWGDTDAGLYLRIAGSFDAVMGFDPFLLAGNFELSGELRLFIVSIGASASLDILVVGQTGGFKTHIQGDACGHVDFFFFSVEGCVSITIGSDNAKPDLPDLVQKLSIKSRSPALLVGTGVDRPIDTSLGEGVAQTAQPDSADARLPVVPIDSVPVLGLSMPPIAPGLQFMGAAVANSTGQVTGSYVQRGSEFYAYTLSAVTLQRADGGPALLGSNAPATWWTPADSSTENVNAQLALLTWEPDPATKIIEKTEQRTEQVKDRWSRVCQEAAPPARVLWTFLDEQLGVSRHGWDLEGIAWPDPPETRRKQKPATSVLVTEAWRTGDPQIDDKRGIIPAIVVGSRITCADAGRGTPAPPRLQSDLAAALRAVEFSPSLARTLNALAATPDAPQFARIAQLAQFTPTPRLIEKAARTAPLTTASVDPALITRKLGGRAPLSRQEIDAVFLHPATAAATRTGSSEAKCQTRVLQAPIFDDGRMIVFGNPDDLKEVRAGLDKAGLKHGPLNDVIVLHTGPFADCNVLLFVGRAALAEGIVFLRTLDATGQELSRVALGTADLVTPNNKLPSRWTDPAGPWARDVQDVLGWAQDSRAVGFLPVWKAVKDGKQADRIEIGVVDRADTDKQREDIARKTGVVPPFFLAAFDDLSIAEIARQDSEAFEIKQEQAVLTQILGPGATDDAYLVPNKLYRIDAIWTGVRQSGGTRGATQTFWFRTDSAAPLRLDPWVLLTTPADGEGSAFCREALRIVFNTHNVDRLFAAYGKVLRVRFTASTAHHPASTPTSKHPFQLDATTLKPVGAGILSPWEEAAQEAVKGAGLTCIPVDENRDRQSSATIDIPLDPYTDYHMDVIMVDTGAPESADGDRIYRRNFSTGAYDSLAQFAADLQSLKPSHRAVEPGKLAAVATFFASRQPQGAELDDQLRAAGLLAKPGLPGARVQVLWEQAGAAPPQPAALLLEAPEPLWRSRPHPEKQTDTTGLSNAQRWVLGSREWMQLQVAAGATAPIAPNGFIRSPSGTLALLVLGTGARGKQVTLDLLRTASTDLYLLIPEERHTIVDIALLAAPWEE